MCLLKSTIFPKIAKEPIIVYKYMVYYQGDWVQSPFLLGPLYKIGDTMKSGLSPLFGILKTKIGKEGVHSVFDESGSEFPSYRRSLFVDLCFVMCEIPKGALYYTNYYKSEFASGKLKLLKIVSIDHGLGNTEKIRKQRNIKKIKHGQKRRKNA